MSTEGDIIKEFQQENLRKGTLKLQKGICQQISLDFICKGIDLAVLCTPHPLIPGSEYEYESSTDRPDPAVVLGAVHASVRQGQSRWTLKFTTQPQRTRLQEVTQVRKP